VFPGTEGDAPYEATSTPKPPNLYGQTKYEGEKAVLAEYEKAGKPGWGVVLRVPVLYGEAENPSESAVNVLMDAVWKAQEKDAAIKMDHWAIRYPTNTEDVGRVCQGMFFQAIFCILPLTKLCHRRGSQISRDRRQIDPPPDPAVLIRRQIHEI
jgi:dTDP-4-dehydrorhamnose reductase